jgi:hypothetical protein
MKGDKIMACGKNNTPRIAQQVHQILKTLKPAPIELQQLAGFIGQCYIFSDLSIKNPHILIVDTCGELCVAMQSRFLEILDFTQFFDHFVFTPNAQNVLEKELKREIPVSVGIELVVVDMSRNA